MFLRFFVFLTMAVLMCSTKHLVLFKKQTDFQMHYGTFQSASSCSKKHTKHPLAVFVKTVFSYERQPIGVIAALQTTK